MRILVTGAAGSIGVALVPALRDLGHEVIATDIDTLDVTNRGQVDQKLAAIQPDLIYHLAGAKHAPEGEQDPEQVARVNITGTANIAQAAGGAKVVLASTCKAADPETAYGASKLIAERIILNAQGVVLRYFNVRETSGNVFRHWEQIPVPQPIPWTDCWRYFITLSEALELTVAAVDLPSGRYTVDPGPARHMRAEARSLYPDRRLVEIPARRGDRRREPFHADCEQHHRQGHFFQIVNPHDPVPEPVAAAA